MANFNARNEAARGYLLLGVFFIHCLYDATYFMTDWRQAPVSFALIKILSPLISIYFFLSGLSMQGIGKKSLRSLLPQSLMLIFVSWVSEGLAIIIRNLLYGGYGYGIQFIKAALKPIVYGTGGCNYITWFFTVLAVARILAWIFERNKIYFVLTWMVIAGLILAAKHLHLPDNIYEWREWPAATLFIVIGMKFPKDWKVPRAVGLGALVGSVLLLWFNVPDIWTTRPCLTCNMLFAAAPSVGGFGSLPVFIAGVFLNFLFVLWAAQDPYPAVIGKVGRYFGRPSLQFLLLHGWVLVTIEPIIASYFPLHEKIPENLILVLGLLIFIPAIHAVIFNYSEGFLNRVLNVCFKYGRSVTDGCFRWAGLGEADGRRYSNG